MNILLDDCKKVVQTNKNRDKIEEVLRKISRTFVNADRIRSNTRKNEYIIPSKPKMDKLDISEVIKAEEHLRKALKTNLMNNSLKEGISNKEAEIILDWVVYNARVSLNKLGEDIYSTTLMGACGLGQSLTSFPLESMGLDAKTTNVHSCLSPEAGNHAFLVVGFPVKTNTNIVEQKNYLVDVTYKQFCLSERCNIGRFYSNDERFKGKCTPDPGYFANLSKKGRVVIAKLLKYGYIELSPENAKIYGDSFKLCERGLYYYQGNLDSKNFKTNMSGEEYIKGFTSNLVENDYSKDEFKEWGLDLETPYDKLYKK